jgi:putative two-component system response regulator
MGALAEARDEETGAHILRTREYVKLLGIALSQLPAYSNTLNARTINLISRAAPLHDIGKVGVPDSILRKRGKLSLPERKQMDQHVIYGRDAIINAERQIGATDFTAVAKEIAYSHHEKWDGSGYLQGLFGDQIPLSARMMAVADVYDALVSRRHYKPAMSHTEAKDQIIRGRGSHFDPDLVDAFLTCDEAFSDIAEQYRDNNGISLNEPANNEQEMP